MKPIDTPWQREVARRELDHLMVKRLRNHQASSVQLTETEQLLIAALARLLEVAHER